MCAKEFSARNFSSPAGSKMAGTVKCFPVLHKRGTRTVPLALRSICPDLYNVTTFAFAL